MKDIFIWLGMNYIKNIKNLDRLVIIYCALISWLFMKKLDEINSEL